MLHVVLLIVCAIAIYLACEAFVNAVEWLGPRLSMGSNAVGSILAAVGTALPESIVTLVAVLWGSKEAGDDIGIGAALGGPLVVGTISYAVVGIVLWFMFRRRPAAEAMAGIDPRRVVRDETWFLAVYVFKVGLGLVAFAIKPWLGIAFFVVYGIYFWREMAGDGEEASTEGLERLTFWRGQGEPPTWVIVVQTLTMLVIIFASSQLFVQQLEWAGPKMGLHPTVVAMLLAPIATELPETLNAFIFTRKGKPQLALANITGSMMIQVTVPSGIGLLGTPWLLNTPLLVAAVATFVAVGYLLALFKTGRMTPLRLAAAGLFYVAFAGALAVVL